uniref:Uncharacterized protein n=1 Tax=Syphacia muris TaxID=451379 RepID=A0A0N5AAE0_9BILA
MNITPMISRESYVRKTLRKPKCPPPRPQLSYGSAPITRLLPHVLDGISYLGWLDTLIHAPGYVIEKLTA